MSGKDTPQNVIEKFKKRQKMMPYLLGAIAVVLAIVGIVIIVTVVSGGKPFAGIFSTKTPTPTNTLPPTATSTASLTPTITQTPTLSATATASGPMYYEVQQYDTCYDIAVSFNVDLLVLLAINNFTAGTCPITPGQQIIIPAPGSQLPTATPIPSDLPRGTEIEYTVQANDTLAVIAAKFNSTIELIKSKNKLTNDVIYMGQVLVVPVNMVTPTKTVAPTSTLAYPQVTKPATATPSPTKKP